MAEIIHIPITRHYIPADEVLTIIAEDKPDNVFVICWPNDGSKPNYHSTTGDMPLVLMQLQRFMHKYFNGDFEWDSD